MSSLMWFSRLKIQNNWNSFCFLYRYSYRHLDIGQLWTSHLSISDGHMDTTIFQASLMGDKGKEYSPFLSSSHCHLVRF